MSYKPQRYVSKRHKFFKNRCIPLHKKKSNINRSEPSEVSPTKSLTEICEGSSDNAVISSISDSEMSYSEGSISSISDGFDSNDESFFGENFDFSDSQNIEKFLCNSSNAWNLKEYVSIFYALASNRISQRSYDNLITIIKVLQL